ncbi:MAG: GNAT family N-acetyltransferase [Clostridia bacterium]|nr:GNAT family N-acetyltransferase [Clostridia bacterium]
MAEIVRAQRDRLEELWAYNIQNDPGEPRWEVWRDEYIGYNLSGKAVTYAIICGGVAVGEGTLILDPSCKAVRGRPALCDGEKIANVNALRIRRAFRGRSFSTALVRKMEEEAKNMGFSALTIGVEAAETRNLAIYLHWGYDKFIFSETDEGQLVLYYRKDL